MTFLNLTRTLHNSKIIGDEIKQRLRLRTQTHLGPKTYLSRGAIFVSLGTMKRPLGTVAVLGAGKIGSVVALSLAASGRARKVIAVRKSRGAPALSPEIESGGDAAVAAARADILVLAVKPGDAKALMRAIGRRARGKLAVSLMAAITTKRLEEGLAGAKVVRAMPNIAATIGESMTAYCLGRGISAGDAARARGVLDAFGESLEVPEHLMDAVAALSGSGPAYIAMLVEALVSAGLKVGIPRDTALKLATKTLTGTANLLSARGVHPAELRDSVTTPAGTTIAGLYELEKGSLRTAIMNAVEAATLAAERIARKFEAAD